MRRRAALADAAPAAPGLFARAVRSLGARRRRGVALPRPRLLFEMAAVDLCAAEPLVPLGDLLSASTTWRGACVAGAGAPARRRWWRAPRRARPRRRRAGRRAPDARLRGGRHAAAPSGARAAAPPVAASPPRTPGRRALRAAPAVRPAKAPAPSRVAAPPPRPADEVWRRIRGGFEAKRAAGWPRCWPTPRSATLPPGAVTLVFPDKCDADAGEKARGEIERGGHGRARPADARDDHASAVRRRHGGTRRVRSEVGSETDAVAADRQEPRGRGAPAPDHPEGAGRRSAPR